MACEAGVSLFDHFGERRVCPTKAKANEHEVFFLCVWKLDTALCEHETTQQEFGLFNVYKKARAGNDAEMIKHFSGRQKTLATTVQQSHQAKW